MSRLADRRGVGESGDPVVVTQEILGLFVAAGENPYTLCAQAAESVMPYLRTGRLRSEKLAPVFPDRFG